MTNERKSKLETLKERQEKLAARIRLVEAKERQQGKRLDTRRKILVGAMVLDQAEKDDAFRARLYKDLDGWLVRDIDRRAFGFGDKGGSNG